MKKKKLNTARKQTLPRLNAVTIMVALLAAAVDPAWADEPKPIAPPQASVSPQEYFADRIRMESGQPAIDSIPELYD